MSDIVERLRVGGYDFVDFDEAADEIERLRARSDGLRDALRFYVEEVEALTRYANRADKVHAIEAVITVLTLDGGKRGRAALAMDPEKGVKKE